MLARDDYVRVILEDFPHKRILVLGDLMVDEYIIGSVSRISPEAPVAVLNFEEKQRRAGGAANVAANVRSLGASVIACGIASQDDCGDSSCSAWTLKRTTAYSPVRRIPCWTS